MLNNISDIKTYTIIVTYNATKNNWITKCLNSLLNSSIQTHIIVIDNASKDNTTKIIEDLYPKIELIKSKINLGFAKANNIGIKRALKYDADFVFLLNQDAWVENQTIENLIKTHYKNTNYGLLSPIHFNGDGSLLDFKFSTYINQHYGRKLFADLLKNNKTEEVYPVNFVNAACWLLSKKAIKNTGIFDDFLFKHYGEDDNYCQRLLYHNFKIGIVHNSFIYHDREFRGNKRDNDFSEYNKSLFFIKTGANLIDNEANAKMKKILNENIKAVMKNMILFKFKLSIASIKQYLNQKKLLNKIIKQKKEYKKKGFNLLTL